MSITYLKQKRADSSQQLIDEFLVELKNQNRSVNTIRSYQADLKAFFNFYQGSLSNLTAPVIREYFATTLSSLKPTTQSRKKASLSSFLTWCYQNDFIPSNPIDKIGKIKLPETQPRFLPMDQVEAILKAIDNDRDRVLFTLISETGLRISEALNLKVEDLRLESEELRVIGKGRKERTVHLVKTKSLRLLKAFLRQTKIHQGLIFRPDSSKQRYGASGKPIDYSVIFRAWDRYCERAGVACTIHQLRHSYATALINKGVSVEVVRKILGHANLQTTLRYAQVSDQSVRNALEECL